jgi:hypothetical protein
VKRPAYGGTCYSDFDVGTTATVTAYDQAGTTKLVQWVASTPGAQAYAHPMDGFAAGDLHPTLGCPVPLSQSIAPSILPQATASSLPHGQPLPRATIAGIASGASCGLIAVIVLVWLALRSHRKRRSQPLSPRPTIVHMDYEQSKLDMHKQAITRARNGSHGTLEAQENPILEKEALERYEIGCGSARSSALHKQKGEVQVPVELDADSLAELEAEHVKSDFKYTYSPI